MISTVRRHNDIFKMVLAKCNEANESAVHFLIGLVRLGAIEHGRCHAEAERKMMCQSTAV